jgi:hypothetical protein
MPTPTALITGGTSGIGRATATLPHARGYQVVVSGQNPDTWPMRKDLPDDIVALQANTRFLADAGRVMDEFRTRSIVFTVVIGATRGITGGGVAASRGALLSMVPSLALELAPRRIPPLPTSGHQSYSGALGTASIHSASVDNIQLAIRDLALNGIMAQDGRDPGHRHDRRRPRPDLGEAGGGQSRGAVNRPGEGGDSGRGCAPHGTANCPGAAGRKNADSRRSWREMRVARAKGRGLRDCRFR